MTGFIPPYDTDESMSKTRAKANPISLKSASLNSTGQTALLGRVRAAARLVDWLKTDSYKLIDLPRANICRARRPSR